MAKRLNRKNQSLTDFLFSEQIYIKRRHACHLSQRRRSMDQNQIIMLAANRESLGQDEPVYVRALYWRLRCLYLEYNHGEISQSYGAGEKADAIKQFHKDQTEFILNCRCADSAAQLWKNVESSGSTYANDRTLENADRLWAAILNLPEGSRPKIYGQETG